MSQHYELFYCLETSIRKLISDTLSDAEGAGWWQSSRVAPNIRSDIDKRIQREVDSGVTRRSDDSIDYTTFGELAVLITDRKSTRLNSSHVAISYAVSCLKKNRSH